MKFLLVVSIINLAQLIHFCASDVHSYGEYLQYYTHKIYERQLIEDYNKVPKNYTIIYKYFGSYFKPIAYIEIDVNVASSGYIHQKRETVALRYDQGSRDRQIFDAKVHINNGLNVTATVRIYGQGMAGFSMGGWLKNDEATKSLTYIYVKNSRPSVNAKPFAQNSIGKRRNGDELIHFESRNVTNVSRFPSRSFEYSGKEYITYVGFSFNSPTAMAMVNTSYVGEQEFNAVAYDMNTEHFVANMSIYGIKSVLRPDKFLGVI